MRAIASRGPVFGWPGERATRLVPCSRRERRTKLLERAVDTPRGVDRDRHWQKDRELIEAEELLAHALDVDEFDEDDEVPERVRKRFDAMIARRAAGEPVQLIKGYAEFRGMRLIARSGRVHPARLERVPRGAGDPAVTAQAFAGARRHRDRWRPGGARRRREVPSARVVREATSRRTPSPWRGATRRRSGSRT